MSKTFFFIRRFSDMVERRPGDLHAVLALRRSFTATQWHCNFTFSCCGRNATQRNAPKCRCNATQLQRKCNAPALFAALTRQREEKGIQKDKEIKDV
jgi:hypothetical protein